MSLVVERSLAAHLSLRPQVEAVLRALPETALFHDVHGLKHPLTQYRKSLGTIGVTWLEVLRLHEHARLAAALGRYETGERELSDSYRKLLERLNEHTDTAHAVLRSLRPPISGRETRFHTDFLERTGLPGWTRLKQIIKDKYREGRLGSTVNLLKHEGAELREVRLVSNSKVALGFFVEGARGSGTVGPHKDMHKPWKNCETAYSYAFDMLHHFYGLFHLADALEACIRATVREDHGLTITPAYRADEASGHWNSLCLGLASLPVDVFPDERARSHPVVRCSDDGATLRVAVEVPQRLSHAESFRVTCTVWPEEGALSIVMPYFVKQPGPA